MKKIPIYMQHPGVKDEERIRSLLKWDEREDGLEFVFDSDNPDYVIITEMIYYSIDCRKEFLCLFKKRPIVIFSPFEFIVPDMNFCDYALVWNRDMSMEDRIFRKPTLFHYNGLASRVVERKPCDKEMAKRSFCNFIYSNGSAHPYRDKLFEELSKYKKVDSLGKHLNNVGNIPTRSTDNWLDDSINLKRGYKFSISCNNHLIKGGIDEKLLTSFAANSVPIFWGDPSVEEEFNPEAIIDCSKFKTMDELIQYIEKIDQDDELYLNKLNAPVQLAWQIERDKSEIDRYYSFIRNIFLNEKEDVRRAGEGTARDNYMRWFEYGDCSAKSSLLHTMKGYCRALNKKAMGLFG